jgi:hypothetical protein
VNVKFFKRIRDWRLGVCTKRVVTAGTVSAMILLSFNALLASPSSAVGTLTNVIMASGQPLAASSTGCTLKAEKVTFEKQGTCVIIFSDPSTGAFAAATPVTEKLTIYAVNFIHTSVSPKTATVGETYAASASASSKDPVVITIDNKSLGCGITNQLVTFTQNGNCIVDFNDTGNGVYGPAKQVQQIIVVGKGGLRSQASFYLTSLNGIDRKTLTLTSGGGSGTGPVTYVTTPGSANCSIVGDVLSYSRVGVCVVTATKAGDPTYNLMRALPAHVVINVAGSPRASHVGTAVWSGRSLSTTIVGTGFYGIPKVASSVRSTKVVVTHDSGNVLAIHASFVKNTQSGVHTLTITFAHGQRTLVLYKQS